MKKFLSVLLSAVMVFNLTGWNFASAETEIDAGYDVDSAAEIYFDTEYVSSVDTADEEDWFKFTTISEEAFYNIEIFCYTGIRKTVVLCTKYEKELGKADAGSESDSINVKLEPDTTYYFKVLPRGSSLGQTGDDYTGNYGVIVSYNVDELGDTFEEAKEIRFGNEYTYTLDGVEDEDYFAFTPSNSGTYEFYFASGTGGEKDAKLYNSSKVKLTELDNGSLWGLPSGYDRTTETDLVGGEKYYICVSNYSEYNFEGNDEYTLSVSLKGGTVADSGNNNSYDDNDEEWDPMPIVPPPTQGGGYVDEDDDSYYDDNDSYYDDSSNNTSSTTQITFKDVSYIQSSWAGAVYDMVRANVIKGYPDGNFGPGVILSRAEAAVIICRMLGYYDLPAANTVFTDVGRDYDWASGFIAKANSLGIIGGVGNGRYNPAGKLTYAEFTKMLLCMYGYDQHGTGARWWEAYTNYAYSIGLYDTIDWWGMNECKLAQSIPLDRARACVMASNAMKILK